MMMYVSQHIQLKDGPGGKGEEEKEDHQNNRENGEEKRQNLFS